MLSRDEVHACGSLSVTFPLALSSPQLRVDAVDQGKMANLLAQLSLQGPCSPFPERAFTKNGQDDR